MVTWVGPTRDPNAAGNPFDNYVNAFSSIQNMQKQQDETALRNYLAQHGPSILGGDENALRGLASQPGGLEAAAGAQEMNQERSQRAAAMLGRMILDVETPDQFEQAKAFAGRAGLVPPEKLSAYTFNDLPQLKRMVADSGNDWQRYRNVPGVGLVDLGAIGPDGRPTVVYEQPDTGIWIDTPEGPVLMPRRIGGAGGGAGGVRPAGAIPYDVSAEEAEAAAERETAVLAAKRADEAPEVQAKAEKQADAASTSSGVITTAANRALEAARNREFGSFGSGLAAYNPYSSSAELYRQIDVLRANAKVEALQAMRNNSPTGGALGSVTEGETKMLADTAGALDPNSPNIERDILDYTRTLLQIVHGREAGEAIFRQMVGGDPGSQAAPSGPTGAQRRIKVGNQFLNETPEGWADDSGRIIYGPDGQPVR